MNNKVLIGSGLLILLVIVVLFTALLSQESDRYDAEAPSAQEYFGVKFSNVPLEVDSVRKVFRDKVIIDEVTPGGLFDKAGIKAGSIVHGHSPFELEVILTMAVPSIIGNDRVELLVSHPIPGKDPTAQTKPELVILQR